MKRWILIIPLVALLGLIVLVGVQLLEGQRVTFEGVQRNAPDRNFQALDGRPAVNFTTGLEDAVVVNLFASWCSPCVAEHPVLMQLANDMPNKVYGILYKDSAEAGGAFLDRLGNPFTRVLIDEDGQGGLDFGLTGVPETFVVDKDGVILLHIRGVLTPKNVEEITGLIRSS